MTAAAPADEERGTGLAILAPLRLEARAIRAGARDARVHRTGVGRRRSGRAARALDPRAGAIAVAGLCGGLDPVLRPGDLVVASEVRADGETRACDRPEDLVSILEGLCLGARVHLGPIVCVDHAVRGKERAELWKGGALAVDMESGWLAPGAGARPFAVLRAVLDTPDRELISPATPLRALAALRVLRAAVPALEIWASGQRPGPTPQLRENS